MASLSDLTTAPDLLVFACGPAGEGAPPTARGGATITQPAQDLKGDPSPKVELPDDVVMQVTRQGGIAGINERVTLYRDGTVKVTDPRAGARRGRTFSVPRERVRRLEETFQSREWQGLREQYGRRIADGITAEILAGGKRVTTLGSGEGYPPGLIDVLNETRAILSLAP